MNIKITEYGAIKSAGSVKKRGAAGLTGNFAELLSVGENEEATGIHQLSDLSATAAVDNMLALQEITEEEVQRKKLIQKGKNLLDEMEKLRTQLLIGSVPMATLQDLGRQLSIQRQLVSDPVLIALIDDIELRAAVELAKLEMAAAARSEDPTL